MRDNIIYEETNKISTLKEIKDNCIQHIFNQNLMHCNYEINTITEIVEIGTNVIIVINGNFKVNHTYNEFPITLNGNYLIYIENCQIYLQKWYNKKSCSDTIIIPNPIRKITTINFRITSIQKHWKYQNYQRIETTRKNSTYIYVHYCNNNNYLSLYLYLF